MHGKGNASMKMQRAPHFTDGNCTASTTNYRSSTQEDEGSPLGPSLSHCFGVQIELYEQCQRAPGPSGAGLSPGQGIPVASRERLCIRLGRT